MKRNFLYLIISLIIVLSFGCRERGFKGSGDVVTEQRDIGEFSELEVYGAYNINLEVGTKTSLSVSAEDNLQKFIRCEVENNRLLIENTKSILPKRKIVINIETTELVGIYSLGISNIIADRIDEQTFDVELSRAGVIELRGKVETLNAELSGVALLDSKELFARFVNIDVNSSANAEVNVSEKLTADLSDAGNLTYFGDPLDVESSISGVGNITKGEW